jgi:hypothetical protein
MGKVESIDPRTGEVVGVVGLARRLAMSTSHAVPQLMPRRLWRLSGGLAAPRCCDRWPVSSSPAAPKLLR